MGRRIPRKLLPHHNLVVVEPYLGGGANGRSFGPAETVEWSQIDDKTVLVRDQYDKETVSSTTVYFETDALSTLPPLESRVTVWQGLPGERDTHIVAISRRMHPRIADFLEVRLA